MVVVEKANKNPTSINHFSGLPFSRVRARLVVHTKFELTNFYFKGKKPGEEGDDALEVGGLDDQYVSGEFCELMNF